MARLKLVLVTLERPLLSEECDEVTLPGELGYFGVLPDHAPLLSVLKAGELNYRVSGRTRSIALDGGFCEVHADVVTVLADHAMLPDEIDVAAARQRLREAEEELHRALDEGFAEALKRFEIAQTQLQVAARR